MKSRRILFSIAATSLGALSICLAQEQTEQVSIVYDDTKVEVEEDSIPLDTMVDVSDEYSKAAWYVLNNDMSIPSTDLAEANLRISGFTSLGMKEAGVRTLDNMLQLMPCDSVDYSLSFTDPVSVYRRKASLLCDLNRYEEALDCATKAMMLEPQNPALYVERAAIYTELNMPDEAKEDLDFALSYSLGDPDLMLYCTSQYIIQMTKLGRVEEAAESLPLLSLCSERAYYGASNELAATFSLMFGMEDYDAAAKIMFSYGDSAFSLMLSDCLDAERCKLMLPYLIKNLSKDNEITMPEQWNVVAQTAYYAGDYKQAAKYCEMSLKKEPNMYKYEILLYSQYNLNDSKGIRNTLKSMEKYAQDTSWVDPDDFIDTYLLNYARNEYADAQRTYLYRIGDIEGAKMIPIDLEGGTSMTAYLDYALYEMLLGNYETALECYETAEQQPTWYENAIYLFLSHGDALKFLGRTDEAKEYYLKSLEVNENYKEYSYAIYCLVHLGRYDEAKDLISKSILSDPERMQDKHNLYTVGAAYSIMGDTDLALEYIGKAIDAGTGRPFERWYLEHDQDLDNLRNTPGYKALLKKLN